VLTLWGKGGYGGSPNVEAGKMYQIRTKLIFLPSKLVSGPGLAVDVTSLYLYKNLVKN
jgi:hypothetical protein